jgi:excisionase family DNA binding protein
MRYLTTTEAAAILGITRCRVRVLIHEGRLKAQRMGRDWMVPEPACRMFRLIERRPGRKAKTEGQE